MSERNEHNVVHRSGRHGGRDADADASALIDAFREVPEAMSMK